MARDAKFDSQGRNRTSQEDLSVSDAAPREVRARFVARKGERPALLPSKNKKPGFVISRRRRATMAAKPEQKVTEMVKDDREDSGDWLAGIFDAADEDVITSLEMSEMSLPQETIAALEAEGSGAACAPGSNEKRGREEGGRESAKNKKSRREKLRREALNDRFMGLSALLDPNGAGPLKTDKATIVTEAAVVIKRLREELAKLSATLETLQKTNATLEKEKSDLAADKAALQQDKAKLEHQLHCFVSSLPFASPPPGAAFAPVPGPFHPPGAAGAVVTQQNRGAVKLAPNQPAGGMMPVMWSLPPLVVHTTTAEEDAKLHAPCA